MRRLQGTGGARDPEEERRITRESVISNLIIFGVFIAVIRTAPILLRNI